MKSEENIFTVAVGASAGGLEAIEDMFENIPSYSGMAFIIVQHLSPDYKSLMVELLSKRTKMKVFRAENEMEIRKNCVYLIPPKKNMTIYHNHLILSEQDRTHGLNLPIDIFFKSLAKDSADKAIGVILSGTGSDGTSGLKEIKENGGLIIVQDPETAQFDGMPQSAINTGLVDFVLPAAEIGDKIVSYINSPSLSLADNPKTLGTHQDGLFRIFALIRDKHKIDYSYYKMSTMVRRIERRMSLNQMENMNEYVRYLETNSREVSTLYRELLIGVTSFFRDTEAFSIIKEDIIPQLLNKNENHEIRIWVAGCSTGEEPYSLAILCHEYLEKTGNRAEVKIFATDVDQDAIVKAGNGVFNESIINEISETILMKYFTKTDTGFKISRNIREMVVFAKHNLVKDPPFPKIDLITCRNLLIYLQPSLQNKVFEFFNFSLNQNGFLFLGSSESIGDYSQYFDTVNHKWKIYKSLGKSSVIDLNKISIPLQSRTPGLREQYRSSRLLQIQEEERILNRFLESTIDKYLPLSIIFNDQGNLLHIVGDASKFLTFPTGKVTNSLSKLIKKELEIPVSTAIQKLFIKHEDIIYSNFKIQTNDAIELYNLKFVLLEGKRHQEPLGALFFEKVEVVIDENETYVPSSMDIGEQAEQRIADLEQELQFTKENLQATIEELETSNEELQAANEELLASNEELQSTNEELQSVNEELHTVNTEHQSKIIELTVLNNDIENLIDKLELAAVFFDDNLELRKFTPKANEILNIQDGDLGKNFDHILHHWDTPNLCGLIEQVQFTGEPLTAEFVNGQRTYIVDVKPYLISSDARSGIILTLVEVTKLRNVQELLNKDGKWLKQVADLALVGGWEIDLATQKTFWTDAVYKIHDVDKEFDHNIENGIGFYSKDDQKTIENAVIKCMENGESFDLTLELISKNNVLKKVRVIGKADRDGEKIKRVYGVIQDISELVKFKEIAKNLEAKNLELKDKIEKNNN